MRNRGSSISVTAGVREKRSITGSTEKAIHGDPSITRTGGTMTTGGPVRQAFVWTCRSSRDTITFQGDIYKEDVGERVQVTTYEPPFAHVADDNARLSGGNVMFRWERDLGDGDDLQLQAYYDRTNRYEPNFAEIRDTFDVDFLHRVRLPARNVVSWGLGTRFSAGDALPVVSGLTFNPAQRTDYLLTAFLQDEIGLVENRLSLTLGSKLLKTNFAGVALEPSVRLTWTPDRVQSIWAAFTHALRTPSRAENDFLLSSYLGTNNGVPTFARFDPNTGFRSEQLNGSEMGYRRILGKNLFVDVAAFFNNYHNLFSEDFAGSPFVESNPAPTHVLIPVRFGNGLLGAGTGGEISPEWRPTSFWRLRGSYSYLHLD